ncbi:hypothetical protein ACHAWF_001258 [Thalassiosira exigua]
MTDFPIPDNVKEVLSRIPVKDQGEFGACSSCLRSSSRRPHNAASQVAAMAGAVRGRLAMKENKVRAENAHDDDPHAHYHGHDKCTADHGHADADHGHSNEDEHKHDECKHDHEHKHEHEHKHDHGKKEKTEHNHGHDHGVSIDASGRRLGRSHSLV